MEKRYVNVKLTWNTGYSKIVKMQEYTYNYYVKNRNFITNKDHHCIDWCSDDNKVAVSFKDLICMEIIEEN